MYRTFRLRGRDLRIGIIASPFISVPPPAYGGTELFIANLAEELVRLGANVKVYTNGESTVKTPIRWLFPQHEWPLSTESAGLIKEIDHNAWAIEQANAECDIVHINSALAVPLTRITDKPVVCTLHHPFEPPLSDLYERYSDIRYVSISAHQASLVPGILSQVIYHGIDIARYHFLEQKQPYLCFLGRICPIKGTHNAIEIAKRLGMPLKIAGEIQPIFQSYFEAKILPHLDGKNIEFVGEADFATKNELLSHATALLFPIEWHEPFGLIMIEAMACGTPVIAFPGGAVEELVRDGVAGKVCQDIQECVRVLRTAHFEPRQIRKWAQDNFSSHTMATRYCELYSDLLRLDSCDGSSDRTKAAA
jgi:glycosyltransferase involved in cell wall biosynthesis